ncbi:MAG TPA: glutamate-1-semialdehyde 2,1-aminomutase [Candidatus Avoscillospira avistercoris]|uniref:Glutamate-1-semialdehyde 2,1-aminomutase n=1 Tax=Candidatus Avoscillospira avistercoris TaxID=2840707 RepID=A0A9D1FC62_9FIRM|nr:glutamate-1-semialdehyde 2,1-aminomutase [Candidatus Avoscillospira avistercoris]
MGKSETLFERAKAVIPGGVNSPVRAFGSIGMCPRFIASAKGSTMTDADGKTYIDYVGSWGPMILGHAHPAIEEAVVEAARQGLSFGAATEREVEMAELICQLVPSIEMVRMVNSGTEAVMSAIRVARGFTGRDKIIKFNGCYHGHSDGLLVQAGSGVMTAGIPDSGGVPNGCTRDTLTATYNDLDSVKALFAANQNEIAAIIVEPVAANMGVVLPQPGFLQGLRDICDAHGSLLIFDEVITGFRLKIDGAQGFFGVRPDLTTFGKIIGGGMPVGAYGGRKDVMEVVSPLGAVYQAGTLSGNPVAMAAGLAQLKLLRDNPQWYEELNRTGDWFYGQMEQVLREAGKGYQVNHVGSLCSVFFTDTPVTDYASAKTADTAAFAACARNYFEHGIYVAPSQFEAMFLSMAHTKEQLEQTLDVLKTYLHTKN